MKGGSAVKPKIRKVLIALLGVVFLFSASMMLYQLFQYREADEIYEGAEELANAPDLSSLPDPSELTDILANTPQPDADGSASASAAEPYVDPYADALANMDFQALQEVNSDVKGWVLVPGTKISYPILKGRNNEHYLWYSWRDTKNSCGSIFMECTNRSDFTDFNTILYGHRMNNQSMFGILHSFRKQSYYEAHPCVYISTKSGTYRYDIFAAYEVSVQGDTYRLGFPTTQSKQAFIDYCLSLSSIKTGIVPHTYDSILTMSTCTGHGHATRWVVQAVRRGVPPKKKPAAEPSPAPEQPDVSTPAVPETPEQPDVSTPAVPETPEQPDVSTPTVPETPEQPDASTTAAPETPEQPDVSTPAVPETPEQPEAPATAAPEATAQPDG